MLADFPIPTLDAYDRVYKEGGKMDIYFMPVCHKVAHILKRKNPFYQMSLLVINCDQLSLPLINYTWVYSSCQYAI